MSVEMYLQLAGVEGTATNREHKGWIPVLSCNWGLARTRSRTSTSQVANAVTKGNELKMHKAIGAESPQIMALCAAGAVTEKAQLSIVPAVGKREIQRKYISVTLHQVSVKSIGTAGHCDENFLTEEVLLGFKKMNFDYFLPVNSSPGAAPKEPETRGFAFDFVTQESSST